jgi:hypothetical protein
LEDNITLVKLLYIAIPEPKGKSLEEVSQEDTTLSKPSPATYHIK